MGSRTSGALPHPPIFVMKTETPTDKIKIKQWNLLWKFFSDLENEFVIKFEGQYDMSYVHDVELCGNRMPRDAINYIYQEACFPCTVQNLIQKATKISLTIWKSLMQIRSNGMIH